MSNKLLSKHTWIFTFICLVMNLFLAQVIKITGIPLFLDSIGTIVAGALCGAIPGIAVGFLSNFINSVIHSDPVTCYYGVLSILIALISAWFSSIGVFKSFKKTLLSLFAFSFVGGALGSVMTWVLYGFDFGTGISAPFAILLNNNLGIPKFWAQFTADMGIDLIDKLLTVVIVFLIILVLPSRFLNKLPLGYIYGDKRSFEQALIDIRKGKLFRKHSLRTKITTLIMAITVFLSIISVTVGMVLYRDRMVRKYEVTCRSVSQTMLLSVDGDDIDLFLESGGKSEKYKETEDSLKKTFELFPEIKYMYVYKILPDGCHVVFDLDTQETEGAETGEIIPFDADFKDKLPSLLAGKEIEPVISNGAYGWLMTSYSRVLDSNGVCKAYAAVDIGMDSLTQELSEFFINVLSILFVIFLGITVFSIWYSEKKIIEPIGVLVSMTRDLDYKAEVTSGKKTPRNEAAVKTGDELEELFNSMKASEKEIAGYVSELNFKNGEIAQMQRNIIIALADMVKRRDTNTGEHIARTSAYVNIIGKRLIEKGYMPDTVTADFVNQLTASAPLHDIGKITIPDSILNKPGKLTPEEFEKMKTQTTAGKQILSSALVGIRDSGYIGLAAEIAECHHEKWNGTGYPHGLSGNDIPLSARIMAVADVFDALVSKRSYKDEMPFEEAINIIKKDSGTHFDPEIAAAFIESTDKIKEVNKK